MSTRSGSTLTDPGRLGRWLDEVEGEVRLRGEFRARFFASGSEGSGRIEVCEPPRRLLVRTKDADEPDKPDDHTIEATLAVDGDQTTLACQERACALTCSSPTEAGIQIHVEDAAAYLSDGAQRSESADARWEELVPIETWRPTSLRCPQDEHCASHITNVCGVTVNALANAIATGGATCNAQGNGTATD